MRILHLQHVRHMVKSIFMVIITFHTGLRHLIKKLINFTVVANTCSGKKLFWNFKKQLKLKKLLNMYLKLLKKYLRRNFFKGLFQKFCLYFQIIYFSEHLWIALNTSESAKVTRIYSKSIKQVVVRGNYYFLMQWNFKIDI